MAEKVFECDYMHPDCKVRIAQVTSTSLGYEDHGIFTSSLWLSYGGSSQSAGGYSLDEYSKKDDERHGTAEGMEFIVRTMKACGVDKWESLAGVTILAHTSYTKVYGIEPMPTRNGEPFMFEDLWSEKTDAQREKEKV